jgi:hypothetical protein
VLDLKQVVDVPAHESGSILDLILTYLEAYYEPPFSLGPLAKSDHNILCWKSKKRNRIPKPKKTRILYRPLSESSVQAFGRWIANFDFAAICAITDIDEKVETQYSTMQQKYSEINPVKMRLVCEQDKPGLNSELKIMIKKRCNLHAVGEVSEGNKLRNKVVSALRVSRKRYIREKVAPLLKSDFHKWHDTVKRLTGKQKGTEVRISNIDGSLIRASDVNEFFTQISTSYPTICDE